MAKNCRELLAVLIALLLVLGLSSSALAHAIDYTAYDIQPQADFDGQSGRFRLINPVPAGSIISFRLTLELIESAGGGTSVLPATITFGVKNSVPADMLVRFGEGTAATAAVLPATIVHKYEKVSGKIASLQTAVTAQAPAEPRSYFFKIRAIDGFKGNGLQPGEGIVIHCKVAEQVAEPVETVLNVTLASSNILYRSPSNKITATPTKKLTGEPVAGEFIDFYFEGGKVAMVNTGLDGTAIYEYNTSGLAVGDYSVAAKFQGTGSYISSSGSTNQCVIGTRQNGDYNIRVDLEEGECATGHWVPVRIGKATK